MLIQILVLAITLSIQSGFLLLALWFMVHVQKQQYTFVGLLGSAVLASALDLIPFVGHCLALAILLFCIKAVTRTDFMEVRFTVGISYALMFGMNLFLLGWALGDLRVSARAPFKADAGGVQQTMQVADETEREESVEGASNAAPAESQVLAPPSSAQRPALAGPGAQPDANKPAAVGAPGTPDPALAQFSLKGITRNGARSTVLLHTGVKTYTIQLGESVSVQTSNGKAEVRLEKIQGDTAFFDAGGQPLVLEW